MNIKTSPISVITIDAADWYTNKEFIDFINLPTVATWHRKLHPLDEFSDVFVNYSKGNGSHADNIPTEYWEQICTYCEAEGINEALVWIRNMPGSVDATPKLTVDDWVQQTKPYYSR